MMADKLFVVTISHQLGSGGSALGQRLSERLGIPFIDRDILQKVANQLHVAESVIEEREERLSSFWQSLNRIAVMSNPAECLSLQEYVPDDRSLFNLESDCIGRIAEKSAAIFLGRCGRYILRDHPRHFSILVHADLVDRIRRVQELFCLEAGEAKKLLQRNDRERAAYIYTFTRRDWLDADWYDLCVNTSHLGLEKSAEIAEIGIGNMLKETLVEG